MQKGVCCFPHGWSVYLYMTIAFLLILFVLIFLIFFSMLIFVIGPFMLMQPYRRTVEYYRKPCCIAPPLRSLCRSTKN